MIIGVQCECIDLAKCEWPKLIALPCLNETSGELHLHRIVQYVEGHSVPKTDANKRFKYYYAICTNYTPRLLHDCVEFDTDSMDDSRVPDFMPVYLHEILPNVCTRTHANPHTGLVSIDATNNAYLVSLSVLMGNQCADDTDHSVEKHKFTTNGIYVLERIPSDEPIVQHIRSTEKLLKQACQLAGLVRYRGDDACEFVAHVWGSRYTCTFSLHDSKHVTWKNMHTHRQIMLTNLPLDAFTFLEYLFTLENTTQTAQKYKLLRFLQCNAGAFTATHREYTIGDVHIRGPKDFSMLVHFAMPECVHLPTVTFSLKGGPLIPFTIMGLCTYLQTHDIRFVWIDEA
jgi:hypothetical protein